MNVFREPMGKYRKHGISEKDYAEQFKRQDGRCLICGKHQSEFQKILAVDHDHKSGFLRGLLCFSCNSVLGLAHDNPRILINAARYLIYCKEMELQLEKQGLDNLQIFLTREITP